MTALTEELKAHFLRLYSIAFTDDEFHPLELKMLYQFARDRGISEETLNELLLNPTLVNSSPPETIEDKITYLYQFSEMIWADGKVDENERTSLKKYIKLFGFMDENIDELSNYLLDSVKNNVSLDNVLKEL